VVKGTNLFQSAKPKRSNNPVSTNTADARQQAIRDSSNTVCSSNKNGVNVTPEGFLAAPERSTLTKRDCSQGVVSRA
jgi:hypothetical protein